MYCEGKNFLLNHLQFSKIIQEALISNLFFTTSNFIYGVFLSKTPRIVVFKVQIFTAHLSSFSFTLQTSQPQRLQLVCLTFPISNFWLKILSPVFFWTSRVVRNSFLFGPRFIPLASDQNYTDILSISLQTWLISIILTGEGFVSWLTLLFKQNHSPPPPIKVWRYTPFFYFLHLTLVIRVSPLIKYNKKNTDRKRRLLLYMLLMLRNLDFH